MKKSNRKKDKSIIKGIRAFEWKYHNLFFLIISFFLAFYILKFKPITPFIHRILPLGYFASFVLGIMFAYAPTAAPAAAVFYNLGQELNPFLIAFIGALGAIMSDYLIFRFVRDKLADEIKLFIEEVKNITEPIKNLVFTEEITILLWKKISESRIWKILIPAIAGFIIASPLPDELGVVIFGATKFEAKKFATICYCLNFLGIFFISSLGAI